MTKFQIKWCRLKLVTRLFRNYCKTFKITPSDEVKAYIPKYFNFKTNLKHQMQPKIFENIKKSTIFLIDQH